MLSIYELKDNYRRLRKHLPISDAFARRVYHGYIDLLLARTKTGTFCDVYGLSFNLDRSSLLERQMAAAGYWEEDTKVLIDRFVHPGDTIVEVGANFGAHTLPLAQKVGPQGRVVAFEPVEDAYNRLIANMRLNPQLQNISLHRSYLGEKDDEEVEVAITSRWSIDGSGNDTRLSTFRTTSLDRQCSGLERIDLLKIDVDGAEQSVLKGARQTIMRHWPLLYVEVSGALSGFRSPPDNVCRSLEELGYLLHEYRPISRGFVRFQAGDILRLLEQKPVVNVLAKRA